MDFISQYWLEIGFGIIVSILTGVLRGLWVKFKTFTIEQKAMSNAIKASLRNDIIRAHEFYMKRGYIYIYELDNLEELCKEYCILGGNGVVKVLMDEIRELEKRVK